MFKKSVSVCLILSLAGSQSLLAQQPVQAFSLQQQLDNAFETTVEAGFRIPLGGLKRQAGSRSHVFLNLYSRSASLDYGVGLTHQLGGNHAGTQVTSMIRVRGMKSELALPLADWSGTSHASSTGSRAAYSSAWILLGGLVLLAAVAGGGGSDDEEQEAVLTLSRSSYDKYEAALAEQRKRDEEFSEFMRTECCAPEVPPVIAAPPDIQP